METTKLKPKNLYDIVSLGTKLYGDNPCFIHWEDPEWKTLSFKEAEVLISSLARGLLAEGLCKSNTVCILSETRLEWTLLDIAILSVGGIVVPIYPSTTPSRCKHLIEHSEARWIIVENSLQWEKIEPLARSRKMKVFWIDSIPSLAKGEGMYWKNLIELGKKITEQSFQEKQKTIQESDIASILYTSGTSGIPKGVVLTNQNFLEEIKMATQALPGIKSNKKAFHFLPLAHVFARTTQFIFLYQGVSQIYRRGLENILEDLKNLQPNFIVSVPRFFEKIYERIEEKFHKNKILNFLFPQFFLWLKNQILQISQAQIKEIKKERKNKKNLSENISKNVFKNVSWKIKFKDFLIQHLLAKKLQKSLGGNLDFTIAGGSSINKELSEFFYGLGIPILEGYGLTETTAATHVNRLDDFEFGTVGKPLDGIETRISPEGEILIRSKTVMLSYFKDEEETKQSIQSDGFFHTGDLGSITPGGFLKITGRKKDILITSGGENIPPVPIEDLLKKSVYIEEALLYGNKKKFISTLLIPELTKLEDWAKTKAMPFSSIQELLEHKEVWGLFHSEIQRINRDLQRFEQIKQFVLLPRHLSLEKEELTPTFKPKRKEITQKYQKYLDRLYEKDFDREFPKAKDWIIPEYDDLEF